MKKIIVVLLTLSCNMMELKSQTIFSPNTGDTEMDGILNDVNTNAKKDMNVFADDVANKFGIPKNQIEEVAKVMNPGDVFMSAQVASITKKPFEEVTKTFQANKGKGWGVIAKEMGIKPGSPEFHEMKKAMKTNGNSKSKGKGNSKNKEKGNSKNEGKGNSKANENSNSTEKGKGKKK